MKFWNARFPLREQTPSTTFHFGASVGVVTTVQCHVTHCGLIRTAHLHFLVNFNTEAQKLRNPVTISYILQWLISDIVLYLVVVVFVRQFGMFLNKLISFFSHFWPEHPLKQRIRLNVYFHVWKIEACPEMFSLQGRSSAEWKCFNRMKTNTCCLCKPSAGGETAHRWHLHKHQQLEWINKWPNIVWYFQDRLNTNLNCLIAALDCS